MDTGHARYMENALLLRSLSALQDATPDQIASLLERAKERAFPPGSLLFTAGAAAEVGYLITEGRARIAGEDRPRGVRAVVGLEAALLEASHAASCRAETAVQTLAFGRDELFDVVEDFFDLARGLLSFLARRAIAERPVAAIDDRVESEGERFAACTLDLVERVVFMRRVKLLASAAVDDLARLAGEATEVTFEAADVAFRAGDRAEAYYLVVRGRLGGCGPLAAVGALEVLAQQAHARTIAASTQTVCLRVPAERFFDLLEDHVGLTASIAKQLGALLA